MERRLAAILVTDVVGYSRLMGDGALIEFASVVDAVECAATIQRALAADDPAAAEAPRIQLSGPLG